MQLQNIHNINRQIYLFERLDNGQQKIHIDNNFYPYFFELHPEGTQKTYDGKLAKKVLLNNPHEVAKQRSNASYESDVLYVKRYIIDKVPVINKSSTKYLFLDIEILAKELPDIHNAKYPISCISTYNSAKEEYVTWYLQEWGMNEVAMLEDFIAYIVAEIPDMLLAWNIEFDYTYLYNRYGVLFNSNHNFAEEISPIRATRPGKSKVYYPAGLSILDYMGMFEKLTIGKRRSYALDYIAQEDLAEAPWGTTEFGVLNDVVKAKNINDVKRMVLLESKFGVIPHFDEIRRFSRNLWEDLPTERVIREGKMQTVSNNSKIIDMLVLQEAKNLGIVLPKKPDNQDKEEFEGAYRETYQTGAFFNIGKYDLSGAYLYAIIDLCLDTSNIVTQKEYMLDKSILAIDVTDRKTHTTTAVHFVKQNKNTLLPIVVEKLVNEKNTYKDLLKATSTNDPQYDNIDQKYKAIKGIVLSSWGVIANQYFRLYDNRIASMITSSVRDLLHYVKEEAERLGYPVLYVDTDSVFCNDGGTNIANILNDIIQRWAKAKFNKVSSITFDYEGHFEKILILTKCHYYGYLKSKKGTKKEIKGVEVKKSSSSKFEASFQEELINKVLNKQSRDEILDWVKQEQERIMTLPIQQVSFPSKITNDNYLNEPIFVRACKNSTELFKGFKVERGNLFYYVFVQALGFDSNGKERNVIAFTPEYNVFEKSKRPISIDWDEMKRRNILNKVEGVFEVMGWGNANNILSILNGQTALF